MKFIMDLYNNHLIVLILLIFIIYYVLRNYAKKDYDLFAKIGNFIISIIEKIFTKIAYLFCPPEYKQLHKEREIERKQKERGVR